MEIIQKEEKKWPVGESVKYGWMMSLSPVSPLYPQVPHPRFQPAAYWNYSGKKYPEISNIQNLNLPHTGNYLHCIYNYLYSFYIVFNIINNLEMM